MPASDQQRDDSLRLLSNLLSIYNELVALRRLSVALRRRCAFLENIQSLLRSQNSTLVDVVIGGTAKTRPDERTRRAVGASLKTKRPASSRHQKTAEGEAHNGHRPLQYQGSGGLDGNSKHSPSDGLESAQLKHRSMSVGSLVDLAVESSAAGAEDSMPMDQRDRRRSGKLQEKWQQVKKVITAKLDTGSAAAPTAVGRTKLTQSEKASKSGQKKTTRSASTIAHTGGPSQLHLLTVQQPPGQKSRSVSPRTPSTADSSSCRVPSNTGSSSIGPDTNDRTLDGK